MNRAMPRAGLTASDAFSALRIAFALLIALLYSSARDAAFVVLLAFVLAVATDIVGELLGRGGPTLPGSVLDSLADKALVYSVLVGHGFPMLSFMLPLIARDTVAFALRLVAGGQGTVLVVDRLGRLKTATLYVACAAAVTLAWLQSGSSTVPSALAVPPETSA